MFGFNITSDLLIVAIFAQTIAIALIVLIMYFKIKKIQYKSSDLNEKLEEKLDRVESKLSYLYNQVLVISANQDKFNYSISSLDPSTYYRTRVPTNENSDYSSLLKDTTLYNQNSRDPKTVDTSLTATKAKESETEPIPVIKTSSLPPNNNSFSEISTSSNNLSDPVARNTTVDYVQNNKEPTSSKVFADNDLPSEKNTNPEIDKIEKEILTALKRLGGSEDDDDGGSGGSGGDMNGYGDSSREEVIYPTAKKSDRKVKNID